MGVMGNDQKTMQFGKIKKKNLLKYFLISYCLEFSRCFDNNKIIKICPLISNFFQIFRIKSIFFDTNYLPGKILEKIRYYQNGTSEYAWFCGTHEKKNVEFWLFLLPLVTSKSKNFLKTATEKGVLKWKLGAQIFGAFFAI